MKTYNKILTIAVLFSSMISCTSVLDKEKLDSINPGDVWNNEKMIDAVMNDIHGSLMPGWAYDGHLSDEAPDHRAGMNTFLRGTATIDDWDNWPYSHIEKINLF